jgi:hypothetical protein
MALHYTTFNDNNNKTTRKALRCSTYEVLLVQLVATLPHDGLGGLANRKHGQGSEDERKHGSDLCV